MRFRARRIVRGGVAAMALGLRTFGALAQPRIVSWASAPPSLRLVVWRYSIERTTRKAAMLIVLTDRVVLVRGATKRPDRGQQYAGR